MFAVEMYAAVGRFVFVEGRSRREAERIFGLSRDTFAKMCLYSAPPGYVRSKAPERPKLGPLVPDRLRSRQKVPQFRGIGARGSVCKTLRRRTSAAFRRTSRPSLRSRFSNVRDF